MDIDPLNTSPDSLMNGSILMTIVDGIVRFERP